MRCPKCTERNSVASRKCEYCGERFKRKPSPLGLKLAVGGIAVAMTASIAASIVVPNLADPEQNLARVAKHMSAGPSSVEDANKIKKNFNEAVKAYLKNAGAAKSTDLTQSLQKLLPSSAYEVHVIDLPRGLKIVEIDAILQACDFLVMKTSAGTKVFDLPGFEVFDDARILNDSAGPVLALIGHSGGQPPHRPQVRTYALLPDFISDETEKLVPALIGDGFARFDKSNQDIKLELSKPATGKTASNRVVHGMLRWKDAKYIADYGHAAAVLAQRPDAVASPTPVPVAAAPQPLPPPKIIVRDLTTPVVPEPADKTGTHKHQTPEQTRSVAAVPAPAPAQNTNSRRRHSQESTNSRTSRIGYISGSGVTVRSDARRGADSLGSLGHGESITILGEHEGWYRIRYQGQTAWVFGNLVQTQKPKNNPEPTVTAASTPSRSSRRHRNSSPVIAVTPEPVKSTRTSTSNYSSRSHQASTHVAAVPPTPPPPAAGGGHRKRQAIVEQPNLVP